MSVEIKQRTGRPLHGDDEGHFKYSTKGKRREVKRPSPQILSELASVRY